MIPFGRCLLLWRLERGFSQAALAQKAGIPQPNLSDMERGEREVTLRTLRALAFALGIKPGLLADGIGPGTIGPPLVLSRTRLERVANSVVKGLEPIDPVEKHLVRRISIVTKDLLNAREGKKEKRNNRNLQIQRAWLSLRETYSGPLIQNLIERITQKKSFLADKARAKSL